jgi:hypothetical protein
MIEKLCVGKSYQESKPTKFKECFLVTIFVTILIVIATISVKLANYKNNIFTCETQKTNLLE